MPDSSSILQFADRSSMRSWLQDARTPREGVWLLIGKQGGPVTVTATEALEEALCHGWIDGQMRRIDDFSYLKYFAPRRKGSSWSARNRALADRLIALGLMTPAGLEAIEAAKAGGTWDGPATVVPTSPQIEDLGALIAGREPAHANWLHMPPSVKRTYTAHYLDAKTEATRARRLEWILNRLDQNLKPM